MTRPLLYHFACSHSAEKIGDEGTLLTPAQQGAKFLLSMAWMSKVIWLTDDPAADRLHLGLTSKSLECDRMEHLYVTRGPHLAVRWLDWVREYGMERDVLLALHYGAVRPGIWWVSTEPVNVKRVA